MIGKKNKGVPMFQKGPNIVSFGVEKWSWEKLNKKPEKGLKWSKLGQGF
jgi:hypothetical protein